MPRAQKPPDPWEDEEALDKLDRKIAFESRMNDLLGDGSFMGQLEAFKIANSAARGGVSLTLTSQSQQTLKVLSEATGLARGKVVDWLLYLAHLELKKAEHQIRKELMPVEVGRRNKERRA